MSDAVQVVASPTPNPNAMKLMLNRVVAQQGQTFRNPPAGDVAPWAKDLLAIPGVVSVFGVNTFISISKEPAASWDAIVPKAEAALRRVWT